MFWRCSGPNLDLVIKWTATESATGLKLGLTQAGDYGTFDIYLDGKKIGPTVNLYDTRVTRMEHRLTAAIKPGPHTLTFKCTGKDQRSKRFYFGLDQIDHTDLKEQAKPAVQITQSQAIRNRLTKLLRRAFRRPADAATVERFAKFAEKQIADGASWEMTMRLVVSAVLGMTDFLYI